MDQDTEVPAPYNAGGLNETSSFASLETKRLRRGRKKQSPHEQAILLAAASSQATAAARSIFIAGGTQETAISTARAAAESVLFHEMDRSMIFKSKRQARQQAHVIASMAIISSQSYTPSSKSAFASHDQMADSQTASLSGASSRKPPSVIRPIGQYSRREDLSSVGDCLSLSETDKIRKRLQQNPIKRQARSLRSHLSTQTLPAVVGLPPIAPRLISSTDPLSSTQNSPKRNEEASQSCTSKKSNSSSSYFAKRKAREEMQQHTVDDLVGHIANEDPIYYSNPSAGPHLNDDASRSSGYDSDENSRSVDMTEEGSASNSSEDAFETVNVPDKPNDSKLSFGTMFYDGMLCGPCNGPTGEVEHRDEVCEDNQSQYTRHSDDCMGDEGVIIISPSKSRELTGKGAKIGKHLLPKDQGPYHKGHEKKKKGKSREEKVTREKKAIEKSVKKKDMERLVLRAMATENAISLIPAGASMVSRGDESTNIQSTTSRKHTKDSKASRFSNWILRRKRK